MIKMKANLMLYSKARATSSRYPYANLSSGDVVSKPLCKASAVSVYKALRGGRIVTWKGKTASLSPTLAQLVQSVSPVALASAMLVMPVMLPASLTGGAGQAHAACVVGGGTLTCSGVINAPTTANFGGAGGIDTVVIDQTADIDSGGVGPNTGEAAIALSSVGDGDINVTLQSGAQINTTNGFNGGNNGVRIFQNAGHAGDITLINEGAIIDTRSGDLNRVIYLQSFGGFGNMAVQMDGGLITSGTVADKPNNAHGVFTNKIGGTGDSLISMTDGTINLVSDIFTHGLYTRFEDDVVGNSRIEMSGGAINTHNASGREFGSNGIMADIRFAAGDSTVDMTGGSIGTRGFHSHGIFSSHQGVGDVIVNMSGGTIVTDGTDANGIGIAADNGNYAGATQWGGDSIVNLSGNASIETLGVGSQGIRARANYKSLESDVLINQSGGTIVTRNDGAIGVWTQRWDFNAATFKSDGGISINQTGGSIETFGSASHGVFTDVDKENGVIDIDIAGQVTTRGDGASGIWSMNRQTADNLNAKNTADTTVDVGVTGLIETFGVGSHGIYVQPHDGSVATAVESNVFVNSLGSITTAAGASHGIYVDILGTSGAEIIQNAGTIRTMGDGSHGILTLSTGDAITVMQGTDAAISATGLDAMGVRAEAANDVTIDVDILGAVLGGSGDGAGLFTQKAVGPIASATIDIESTGSVSALSDQAIIDRDNRAVITNNGTITGFVSLGAGDDLFTNYSFNSLNLRDFADDIGSDGIRDTEAASISDFGADDDTFTNMPTGAVRLMTVSAGGGDMFGDRVEQAEFINLETFNNAGLISMWETDGGAAQAGDRITVTNGGASVFNNQGGVLQLDTVLNDDSSLTDRLIVDNSVLDTGPTAINIRNAGGVGAQTLGDGILIVDVAGTSDTGAFVLAEREFAGAYEYTLFQNGLTDPADGDWYLRSTFSAPASVYESAPAILLGGFASLPTYQQRVGQRRWEGNVNADMGPLAQPQGSWIRFTGDRTNVTSKQSTALASYESTSWGLQVGIDMMPIETDNGTLVLGVTGQYGTTDANVVDAMGTASIDSEGYGVGATVTFDSTNGTYVDLQGQVTWIESDFVTAANGDLAKGVDGQAYAFSVGVGHRFAMNDNTALVPQAQLSWGRVESDSFTDNMGSPIDLGSNESLIGRIGLAYEYGYSEGRPFGGQAASEHQSLRENKVYLIGNLLHDLSETSNVTVATTNLSARNNATWAEVGIGSSITWNETSTLYTEGSYSQEFGQNDNDAFDLSAGLRIQF